MTNCKYFQKRSILDDFAIFFIFGVGIIISYFIGLQFGFQYMFWSAIGLSAVAFFIWFYLSPRKLVRVCEDKIEIGDLNIHFSEIKEVIKDGVVVKIYLKGEVSPIVFRLFALSRASEGDKAHYVAVCISDYIKKQKNKQAQEE